MRSIFLISLWFLFSCTGKKHEVHEFATNNPDSARCFRITAGKDYTRTEVFNPWQQAENVKFTYILSSGPANLPDSLRNVSVIKTPVRRVISLSTTHTGIISALGEAGSIIGVSGAGYVNDTMVREALQDNRCHDIGYYPNIDYEKILSLRPDVVFIYGLDGSVQNMAERLKDAGIPSVFVAEYLEEHPLGKAEWIRFFAAFYNCREKGDSIFNHVREHYSSLRDSVASLYDKPLVLSGLPWKDTWFLPGGNSFSARFIADAGGDYLWKDDASKEFIALDLESVFLKALHSDVWINTGSAAAKADIISLDNRFKRLKAFRNDSVFNNNAIVSPGGGNAYWESGVVYPDIILRDLIEIFHPDLLSDHDLYYYRKLE